MVERVRMFQSCGSFSDDDLPPCTSAGRWKKNDTYALKKTGRKSAIKLCSLQAEANSLLADKYKGADSIEFRPGVDVRCMDYCRVNRFCDYWKLKYEGVRNEGLEDREE